jgi:hypothetical protein
MADYNFRYKMNKTYKTHDGSGQLYHHIQAVALEQGSAASWDEAEVVPGCDKNIFVPATESLAIITGAGTNGEKVTAYKTLIANNVNSIHSPNHGWTFEQMELKMDNNDTVDAAFDAFEAFLVTIGQTYPIYFTI